jgi:hypothetical protein
MFTIHPQDGLMRISNSLQLFCSFLFGVCIFAQSQSAPPAASPSYSGSSVADAARANREKNRATVRVRPEDAQELFASVDKILDFVSRDTGYARRTPVKREILSREKFQKEFAGHASEQEQQRQQQLIEQSEIVMKKFGLLPPAFTLKGYASTEAPKMLAAFYRFSDKTMYLFDWIPLESQKHIMAHELTHALQDQNFDLTKFMIRKPEANRPTTPTMSLTKTDDSERSTAYRAVMEGQASLVEAEYILHQAGATEEMDTAFLDRIRNELGNREKPVYVHAAPRILMESIMFPYNEGALFELEVLHKTGRKAAFAGVFARPPISTHEILEPDAYLAQKRMPDFTIPDLQPILAGAFEPYDTGSIGEFDVQVMAEEFGRENDLYSVVPFWNGGGYVAVKKTGIKDELTTADVGLLYLSNWKSLQAAKRFAQIYKAALHKRVQVLSEQVLEPTDCEENKNCMAPLWAARVVTSEGPVFIEVWPGNKLFIAHSFDDKTVSLLRNLVLNPPQTAQMIPLKRELSMTLYNSPVFAALQEQLGQQVQQQILQSLTGSPLASNH